MTVITADDIAAHGWKSLGDALQTVRGFYLINDGLYPSLGARAFGPPGDYNSRLLLVIDGHRTNENIYDSFGAGFDGLVDLQDVERIEIIRGPASSLYGTSAFFGVINVVTTRGRALGGMRMRMESASFGTRDMVLAAGNRFAGGLDAYLSTSIRRSRGRDYFFPELDTTSSGGYSRGLDGEERNRATLRLGWGPLALTGMINARTKDFATGRYSVDIGVPGNKVLDNTSFVGLAVDHSLSATSAVHAQASFHAYDYSGYYMYSGEPSSDWARGRWVVLESQYARTLRGGHRLIAGAQGVTNVRQVQGIREGNEVTFFDDTRQSVAGLYAQSELHLGRAWIANGGVRVDHYSSFGASVNPRLALIRSLGVGSALKVLYGSAFRAPNNFERLYEGLNITSNPELGPERIHTLEVLVEHRLGAHLKVTGSLFRNGAYDLVEGVSTATPGIEQYQNRGRARATGLEAEAEFEWHGARGRASHVWQRGHDATRDAELPNAPRHLFNADVVVPMAHGLVTSIEARAVSSRYSYSRVTVPGFAVANVWLQAPIPLHGVRIAGGIYNLLNTSYGDPTGSDFVQSCIPQAGRTFRVSLEAGRR